MIWFERKKQGNLRIVTLLGHDFHYTKKAKIPPHINKEKIDNLMKDFKESGLSLNSRDPKLIVSLTSFPERMYEIHYTIYSILNQTTKPDKVLLWLAEEQFPNKEKDLPQEVLKLKQNGLTIKWCEDLRSYKKLIPSLKEFPDDIIVIADDDVYYPKNWLKKLYEQHLKYPDCVIGHRCHRITLDDKGMPKPYNKWHKNTTKAKPSYRNFLTGCGGVLYPPYCLFKDVDDIKKFKQLAPFADDIWFWAMTVLNNVKIKTFFGRYRKVLLINPEREMRHTSELTLAKLNVTKDGNNTQMKAVLAEYPEIIEKLKEK